MPTQNHILRRSPRTHLGSYPSCLNECQTSVLQRLGNQQVTPPPSQNDLDQEGRMNPPSADDIYPSPLLPLSVVLARQRETEDCLNPSLSHLSQREVVNNSLAPPESLHSREPSPILQTPLIGNAANNDPSQPPSTFAASTQPPSTFAASTQPPSTLAASTQPPSTYAGTTQPPATFAASTQPPSTYAGTTLPPSADAEESEVHLPLASISNESATLSSAGENQQVSPIPDTENSGLEPNNIEEDVNESRRREMKQLFVHLNRLTVKQQKELATAFKIAHAGNKKVRAAGMYVILSGVMEREDKSAEKLLEAKGNEVRKDFVTGFRRTLDYWCDDDEEEDLPSMSEMEKQGGVLQHPPTTNANDGNAGGSGNQGGASNTTRENVTVEEFARLMLIFRDVPEAAADLRRSGQDLTREQLDLHLNRNAFWDDRIEPLFNDPHTVLRETFDGDLRYIDPGRPVTTFRTGTCLQNMFNNFRKEFTITYKKWAVSGNNNPKTFVDFCYIKDTQTLSKSGTRCLIAFKIFRLGTPLQNTIILDFGTKEMSGDSNAGLESGLVQGNEVFVGSKRRRGSSDDVSAALVDALQTISAETKSERNANSGKNRQELDALAVRGARIENKKRLMESMISAMKYAREMDYDVQADPRMRGLFQTYCKNLADEMENELVEQPNTSA